jgi:type I thyroxine 5'-deiodinase
MYRRLGDEVAFFVVYIREAHPTDAWQLAVNEREGVVFASPRDFGEKAGVARTCVRQLGIELPALIDDFDGATEIAYTAWPDRMYVVDREGALAYKGRPGPFGFRPDEVEAALAGLARAERQAGG